MALFYNHKNISIMKKYILSLTLVLMTMFCFAQAGTFKSELTGKVLDTVTNTATKYQKVIVGAPKTKAAVQVVVLKLTGTSAGVVRLYGSLDGVDYARVASTDSLVVGNVATPQAKIFNLDGCLYPYLRTGFTGVGTMTATIKGRAVYLP